MLLVKWGSSANGDIVHSRNRFHNKKGLLCKSHCPTAVHGLVLFQESDKRDLFVLSISVVTSLSQYIVPFLAQESRRWINDMILYYSITITNRFNL